MSEQIRTVPEGKWSHVLYEVSRRARIEVLVELLVGCACTWATVIVIVANPAAPDNRLTSFVLLLVAMWAFLMPVSVLRNTEARDMVFVSWAFFILNTASFVPIACTFWQPKGVIFGTTVMCLVIAGIFELAVMLSWTAYCDIDTSSWFTGSVP